MLRKLVCQKNSPNSGFFSYRPTEEIAIVQNSRFVTAVGFAYTIAFSTRSDSSRVIASRLARDMLNEYGGMVSDFHGHFTFLVPERATFRLREKLFDIVELADCMGSEPSAKPVPIECTTGWSFCGYQGGGAVYVGAEFCFFRKGSRRKKLFLPTSEHESRGGTALIGYEKIPLNIGPPEYPDIGNRAFVAASIGYEESQKIPNEIIEMPWPIFRDWILERYHLPNGLVEEIPDKFRVDNISATPLI
ncbi:MAG: hypothetical protein HC888_00685 [Candidatus Competibacteraceae bacterium]|nr:hypothetical protein [Candidatus Competibacteraceae bacterium]